MNDNFEMEQQRYFRQKEIHDTLLVITSFRCPICGASLHGRCGSPHYDTLEFKAHIECPQCKMFHAESSTHSNYDKGNYQNDALVEVMNKVRPYIKVFGGVAETNV